MVTVLLVCSGNSCRSQMAEGFLKYFAPHVEVYSAGIEPKEGIDPYAIEIMNEAFLDISKNKPKSVENFVYKRFDYVITLCRFCRGLIAEIIENADNYYHIDIEDPAKARGSRDEILEKYREIRNKIKFEVFNFYLDKIEARELKK